MGIFENIQYFLFILILGSLICSLLSLYIYKYLIIRINNMKFERKNFYECGFKPSIQKPISMSIQFFLICILFILFDTDLLFLYPFVSGITLVSSFDFVLIIVLFFLLYVSIIFEKFNGSFYWKY